MLSWPGQIYPVLFCFALVCSVRFDFHFAGDHCFVETFQLCISLALNCILAGCRASEVVFLLPLLDMLSQVVRDNFRMCCFQGELLRADILPASIKIRPQQMTRIFRGAEARVIEKALVLVEWDRHPVKAGMTSVPPWKASVVSCSDECASLPDIWDVLGMNTDAPSHTS